MLGDACREPGGSQGERFCEDHKCVLTDVSPTEENGSKIIDAEQTGSVSGFL